MSLDKLVELFIDHTAHHPNEVMVSHTDPGDPKFDGSNWTELSRLIALARFQFIQDDDYEDETKKCAYLAAQYTGPALDWVAQLHSNSPATFNSFDGFVTATRQAFGIADNNITALLRADLDKLQWNSDVPVFFANFDRLTLALGLTSHPMRIALVEQKLPHHLKVLLAEQALSFSDYYTMRERLNCMWAINPDRGKAQVARKPRCGNCGKRGHTSTECRGPKK